MQVLKTDYTFIIIGNGIAGTTAARNLRKHSDESILIISDETPYFFSRTALMYVFMGHMRFEDIQPYEKEFWTQNKIDLLQQTVTRISSKENTIMLASGQTIGYATLILATGSKPKHISPLDPEIKGVQSFYHKLDLENLEHWVQDTQNALVVGGGLIGIELAEMLHSRKKNVHFLIREDYFGGMILPVEERKMVTEHLQKHGINLYLEDTVDKLLTDENGRIKYVQTTQGKKITCEWLGLAVGVDPNIGWLQNNLIDTQKGILVNEYLQTNVDNIYAIGDCAQLIHPPKDRKAIEAVWYSGRAMGETVAKTLCGKPTVYNPGPWFNSAKFFDIEYQTYGQVQLKPKKNEEQHLFWKHPKKNRSLRLAFEPSSERFLGIIALGHRLRHHLFDKWIREKRNLSYVIDHLPKADFNPELTRTAYDKMNFKSQWHKLQKA